MDTPFVENLLANWQIYCGGAAVLAFLAWFNKGKLGGIVTTATAAVSGGEKIGSDVVGAYAVHLVELRDLFSKGGEAEAVKAIDDVVLPALFQARDTLNKSAPKPVVTTTEPIA